MLARNDVREIAGYVANMLGAASPASAVGRKLAAWLGAHEALVRIEAQVADRANQGTEKSIPPEVWEELRKSIQECAMRSEPAPIAENARTLGHALSLSNDEIETFTFVLLATHHSALQNLCQQIVETCALTPEELIGVAVGRSPIQVRTSLSTGSLGSLKLIEGIGERPGYFALLVPYRIENALRPPRSDIGTIEASLLGPMAMPSLHWQDFEHVEVERDFAAELLRGAIAQRSLGVNILLYGAPGTGKTELAKAIAAETGSTLFAIGECDEDGDEPTRYDRLCALRLSERLLARRGGSCLLFDEMEDLLQGGRQLDGRGARRVGSKVFLNRLLERNVVPVIWTANALREFDPAFLRRMSFAFEMKLPAERTRKRLWLRACEQRDLPIESGVASALARDYPVSPSLTQSAVRAVSIAGRDASKLEFVMRHLAKAAEGRSVRQSQSGGHCDVDLLNVECDLSAIEACLATAPRSLSFCFYGPPGTGKSAYARRLAARMNLEVMERKGSDFLSKWVGETEQRIAATFEEAASEERFLIIDEVDSLLWRRGESTRSWEVSMVNEFLTNLEAHRMPVACTTNQLGRVDEAALRRFTFKVKFDFLTSEQLEKAFVRYFGLELPASGRDLQNVALGDLAVVRKQRPFMKRADNGEELVAALAAEVAVRSQSPRRIGF